MYLPSPVSGPYLVILLVLAMLICVSLLQGICHVFSKGRIFDKPTNTFHWIANPELVFFNNRFTILTEKFPCGLYDSAHPFRSDR